MNMDSIKVNCTLVNTFTASAVLRRAPRWTSYSPAELDPARFPESDYGGPEPKLLIFDPDDNLNALFIFPTHAARHWAEQARATPLPADALVVIAPLNSLSADDLRELLKGRRGFCIDLNTLTPAARTTLDSLTEPTSFVSTKGDRRYAN
jgi:hypothetical protein